MAIRYVRTMDIKLLIIKIVQTIKLVKTKIATRGCIMKIVIMFINDARVKIIFLSQENCPIAGV